MAINCFDGVNLKIGDKTLEQLFKERTSGNPSELELIEIGTDLAMQYHESLFNELETLRKAVNPKAAKGKYQNPFDKEKLNKAKEEQNKQPQKEQVKVEQPKEEPVAEPAEKQKEVKAEQPTVSEPAKESIEKTKEEAAGEKLTEDIGTPPPPNAKTVDEYESEKEGKRKAVLNNLINGKNTTTQQKSRLEKEGVTYKPRSQKEAQEMAKSIVAEYGAEKAAQLAEDGIFDDDVNAAVFGESLTSLAEQEEAAATQEEKNRFGKIWANTANTFDKEARKRGQFNAYIDYFYKISPIGVVIKENAARKEEFEKFSKGKDEKWEQWWERNLKDLGFAESFKAKVQEELKKERVATRKETRERVHKNIDAWAEKWAKKGSANLPDGTQKAGIGMPELMKGIAATAKLAYDAGVVIEEIVKNAYDEVSKVFSVDETEFSKSLSEILGKEKSNADYEKTYQEKLRKQIKELDEQIAARKRKDKDPKDEKEYSQETKDLIKERDAKKKILDNVTWSKFTDRQIIERLSKRIKGLTNAQKDEVVRRSIDVILTKGGLELPEFREIIGRVTGYGELTDAQAKKLKELAVIRNSVEGEAQKVRDEGEKLRQLKQSKASETEIKKQQKILDESFVQYNKAEIKAGFAAREMNELIWNKPDIIRRLVSVMQLNTLGAVSLMVNPFYNVWQKMLVGYPTNSINSVIDSVAARIAKLAGREYFREYNIREGNAEFWAKLGAGSKEAVSQLLTGLNRKDYIQKEYYGQQIRPNRALQDLVAYSKGKKDLSTRQIWDKVIQAFPSSVAAEAVARLLNVGDKPFRYAAEGAQAVTFAKALKVDDKDDIRIFAAFPREEAYRILINSGVKEEVAAAKADYIRDAIIKEGEKATFQQDNFLTDFLNGGFDRVPMLGGSQSGLSVLTKSLVISPYIKIPANAWWSYYNLANPSLAFAQSLGYGMASQRFKSKGDYVQQKMYEREARYWIAHGIWGVAFQGIIASMVAAGIFIPGSSGDDDKKKREADKYYTAPGTLHLGKLWAWMSGGNPDDVEGGTALAQKWFGVLGMLGNTVARKMQNMTPEEREAERGFFETYLYGYIGEGLGELENGVFANSASLLNAISKGGNVMDNYLLNTMNMFANIIQPATASQFVRSTLNVVPTATGDSFLEKLNQSFAQRSFAYRNLMNVTLHDKRTIWGEPMPRGGNIFTRQLGITKLDDKKEAMPLYKDYLRTADLGFMPPKIDNELNGVKLTASQYDRLIELIGNKRLSTIKPFVSGEEEIAGFGYYKDLSDAVKLRWLQYAYQLSRERAIEQFYSEPENIGTIVEDEDPNEKRITNALFEKANEQLRQNSK